MNISRAAVLRSAGLLLLLLGSATFSGCLSGGGSGAFASVEIRNHSTEVISQTAAAVFREDGYTLRSGGGGQLVFERAGNAANRLAYGDWGNGVVLRVQAQVIPLEPGLYRLQCAASMVRNAGDRILEDEQKLAKVRRGPFQALLDETARRLK